MHDAPRSALSDLSPEELRARAAEYATIAAATRMVGMRESLLRLAEEFERLAEKGKEDEPRQCGDPIAAPYRRNARP